MNRFINQWLTTSILEAVQRLRPVADEAGLTMSQLALAWVLRQENVAAAIIGASRPEQVHENVKAAGLQLSRRHAARDRRRARPGRDPLIRTAAAW